MCDFEERCKKVFQVAEDLYATRPDWRVFHREVLGVNGSARCVFPELDEFQQFRVSGAGVSVMAMLEALRTQGSKHGVGENRVITIRLPESLHASLKKEANENRTSMNRLCVSKLLSRLESSAPDTDEQSANGRTEGFRGLDTSPKFVNDFRSDWRSK